MTCLPLRSGIRRVCGRCLLTGTTKNLTDRFSISLHSGVRADTGIRRLTLIRRAISQAAVCQLVLGVVLPRIMKDILRSQAWV